MISTLINGLTEIQGKMATYLASQFGEEKALEFIRKCKKEKVDVYNGENKSQ